MVQLSKWQLQRAVLWGSPLAWEDFMKQEQLSLYTVNMKLIRNMHYQGDDRVFSVSESVK